MNLKNYKNIPQAAALLAAALAVAGLLAWAGISQAPNGEDNLGGSTAFSNAGGGNWTKYSKLEINYTKASGTVDLINYPVLLTAANFPDGIWTAAQETGCDIRFGYTADNPPTDSSSFTEYAAEKVSFATSTQTAEFYVKIPTLDVDATTTFYVVYGNGSATCNSATDTYGRNNTWTNYVAVFHLNDTTNSTGGTDMTNVNSVEFASGLIGNAADFGTQNATDHKVLTVDTNYGLESGTTTLQALVKIRTEPSLKNFGIVYVGDGAPSYIGQQLYYQNDTNYYHLVMRTKKSVADQYAQKQISAYGTSNWHQTMYRFSAANSLLTGFLDGKMEGSVAASGVGTNSYADKACIGSRYNSSSGLDDYASAYIDEVRYSNKYISDAQGQIEYNNLFDPSSFVTYNIEGTFGDEPTPSGSTINTILEDEAI